MLREGAERPKISFAEFVALVAAMFSLVALSIDAMLPALGEIATDMGVGGTNQAQLVVVVMLFGLGVGQLFYGPISDSYGRRRPIYFGFAIFLLGSVVCLLAQDMTTLLVGRFIQGLGVAGARIVTVAIVRDLFEGAAMARVMSFVMTVFILVPALAPMVGYGIMMFAGWRAIFVMLLTQSLIVLIWFSFRLDETHPPERRSPLSARRIWRATVEIIRNRRSFGYILAAGFVFGAFVGFLSSVQQIFDITFDRKSEFPFWFALLSLALGAASLTNAKLVMRFGMQALSLWSLTISTIISMAFLIFLLGAVDGVAPFWTYIVYMMITFFFFGILFGNLNALAMEPLGHIAGVGASIVGAGTSVISSPLAVLVGQQFDGTIVPLVTGFAIYGLICIFAMRWAGK
ncbi:MAG: multidrug effflux MFS transporter [Alphaproteobacteria bacterium]|jgi:MFS transporter, DHA1 family, multidrug resistance protein|nr:multidrug effflux MFS transporter [Alphaproteobacteria bacterium]MBT4084133.1 multidrug effflux MFS transporter [Alphaproteobacteria bacterium]MBT4546502.1 multidrug effflux MFS transporter [Alphaproteobacteria bacterium]MBT7745043.1 multidrug effflux MFS transporter [Alphaproteobacteria bacterium]